ncbi:unnamed protein product [Symbiodinium sp. CCMP2592]|nr:unnamed protein product [Symbiodinium sp. CCMP2592]
MVADLEDFKRDALRASVHQVKKIYCSPKEQWTFPMLAVYDKQTRSVCINDPAMHSNVPKPSERLDASDMLDLEDIDEIFALDESTRMTDEDIRQAREAELRAESSHGGGADYWEYDPSVHKWTYHAVVPRKAMVHPSKTPGSIGESPDPWKLSTVRISHVQYKDKSPVTIYATGYAFGKTRLMQLWTGTVEFYDDGYAPPKKKLLPYHGSEILEGEGGLPYRQSVPRSERAYKGSRKPNSIDSESWRSMNRAEREGYVEAERREAESHAMSREDSRDAAPVDIAYDSDYESGAERHDKDYWYHDVAAGTITRFHVIERRARFNPTSVKDCPVDPATLTDVRMTMAMTDGTEFTLQDSWRSSDTRSLPCRWTGKTVFVIGSSAKTQIKVRSRVPNTENTGRRVQTANGYYGHALRAKSRTVVPAKSRVCVVTDLEFEPPGGMSARLQPLRGSGLDVCPAMYTYNEGATQSGVDVFNPTDNDVIVEPGQDVAVVQFYTSVLAAVELDFTADDVEGDVSAPVEPPEDGQAVDAEPKKAFPELTFGDRGTSVAQGSVGPREIRMIKYDMRSFMEQCVSRYVELCGPKYKATLRSADTPFLDESRPEFDTNPDRPDVNRLMGRPIDTPVPPGKGVLGDCAAAVLMKILYGARMGRYDLIRPVQALASLITKWAGDILTKACTDAKVREFQAQVAVRLARLEARVPRAMQKGVTLVSVDRAVQQAVARFAEDPVAALPLPWETPLMKAIFSEDDAGALTNLVPASFALKGTPPPLPGASRADLGSAKQPSALKLEGNICEHAIRKFRDDDDLLKEERLLHRATAKWALVVFRYARELGLAPETEEEIIACFGTRSVHTVTKRANTFAAFLRWLDVVSNSNVSAFCDAAYWKYLKFLESSGAAASSATSFLASVRFCKFVLGLSRVEEPSRKCVGLAEKLAGQAGVVRQAAPLTVDQILVIHEALHSEHTSRWDRAFCAYCLVALYGRARHSDLKRVSHIEWDVPQDTDRSRQGSQGYIIIYTKHHKTSRATAKKLRLLPIVIPVAGIHSRPWIHAAQDAFVAVHLTLRGEVGGPLFRPPRSFDSLSLCRRSITSDEVSVFVRLLLGLSRDAPSEGDRVTSHSMKRTCLSWASKAGFDRLTRSCLGRHAYATEGTEAIYSVELSLPHVQKLEALIKFIVNGSFAPDASRALMWAFPPPAAEIASPGHFTVPVETSSVPLADERSGAMEPDSGDEGQSSSSTSSSSSSSESDSDGEPEGSPMKRRRAACADDKRVEPEGGWVVHRRSHILHRVYRDKILMCGRPRTQAYDLVEDITRMGNLVCKTCERNSA